METTGCECPVAGFCKRHGVTKGPRVHRLCQTDEGYFRAWERCEGPLQGKDCIPCKSRGFGDTCAKLFKATGIARVVKWVGNKIKKPCGCGARQEKLNGLLPY